MLVLEGLTRYNPPHASSESLNTSYQAPGSLNLERFQVLDLSKPELISDAGWWLILAFLCGAQLKAILESLIQCRGSENTRTLYRWKRTCASTAHAKSALQFTSMILPREYQSRNQKISVCIVPPVRSPFEDSDAFLNLNAFFGVRC